VEFGLNVRSRGRQIHAVNVLDEVHEAEQNEDGARSSLEHAGERKAPRTKGVAGHASSPSNGCRPAFPARALRGGLPVRLTFRRLRLTARDGNEATGPLQSSGGMRLHVGPSPSTRPANAPANLQSSVDVIPRVVVAIRGLWLVGTHGLLLSGNFYAWWLPPTRSAIFKGRRLEDLQLIGASMADLDCFGQFRAQILDAILHIIRACVLAVGACVPDEPRLDSGSNEVRENPAAASGRGASS
jgi:hypothetical protein